MNGAQLGELRLGLGMDEWATCQQMHALWHDDVADHCKGAGAAGLFQRLLKLAADAVLDQLGLSSVAAEGNEVELPVLMEPLKARGHGRILAETFSFPP
jgi:hypothetical protein